MNQNNTKMNNNNTTDNIKYEKGNYGEHPENLKHMTDKELEYYYYQKSDDESCHKRIKYAKRCVRDYRAKIIVK